MINSLTLILLSNECKVANLLPSTDLVISHTVFVNENKQKLRTEVEEYDLLKSLHFYETMILKFF